jgi:hypothetical protein
MPLVSRRDLAAAMQEDLDAPLFNAHYNRALRMIRTAYTAGDPELATGRALDLVTNVCEGIMIRLFTNLKGVRSVGLSGISLTFGGSDDEITSVLSLTDKERADLELATRLSGDAPAGNRAFTIMWRRT